MKNSAMIGRLIALLFLGRDLAHREHLRTKSFSQHSALGSFYDSIVDIADSIAEAYQGRNGIIESIPMLNNEAVGPIDMVLEKQLDAIEKLRYTAVDRDDTAIQNLIDEAVALYLSTLYKLRNLK
jgi:midasin (ATPase involved in ribosome maturation)